MIGMEMVGVAGVAMVDEGVLEVVAVVGSEVEVSGVEVMVEDGRSDFKNPSTLLFCHKRGVWEVCTLWYLPKGYPWVFMQIPSITLSTSLLKNYHVVINEVHSPASTSSAFST